MYLFGRATAARQVRKQLHGMRRNGLLAGGIEEPHHARIISPLPSKSAQTQRARQHVPIELWHWADLP